MRKKFYLLSTTIIFLLFADMVFGQGGLTWNINNFETAKFDVQGWVNLGWGKSLIGVKRATGNEGAFLELAINFNADATDKKASLGNDYFNLLGWDAAGNPASADTVAFKVWIPADFPASVADFKAFVQDRKKWSWQDDKVNQGNLQRGAWNIITFDVKARKDGGVWTNAEFEGGARCGLEVVGNAGETWTGSLLVDEVKLHGVRRPQPENNLSWVLADFQNAANGTMGFGIAWGSGITEVKQSSGVPVAGDAVLEVKLNFNVANPQSAIVKPDVGVIGWDENGKDKVADKVVMDVYFPADFPAASIGYFQVWCQDQTNWVWQQDDYTASTFTLGAWNELSFDIGKRAETVNRVDVSKNVKVGLQFAPSATMTWSGSIYVDNVRLTHVKKAEAVLASPSITTTLVDNMIGQVSGTPIYFHRIEWKDLAGDIGEKYNIYVSETGPITDVKAAGVVKISENVPRNIKKWEERVYSVDGGPVTRYYAMTTTALDANLNKVETPVLDGVSNTGAITSPSTIINEVPLVSDFNFEVDGYIDEFRGVAETFKRSKLVNENAYVPNGPAWTPETRGDDLNFEMYLVMDAENLYIGVEVIDDEPTNGTSAWEGDGFDVYGVLADWRTATSHYYGNVAPTAGNGGFRIGYCVNAATYETELQRDGYAAWTSNKEGVDYGKDVLDKSYVVEIKIPFKTMAAEFGGDVFVPQTGMLVPFKVDINDNDGNDDPYWLSSWGHNRSLQLHWGAVPGNFNGWERAEGWTPMLVTDTPTAVSESNGQMPLTTELFRNYPNPFNPTTTITYQLAQAGPVQVKIFNVLGHEIKTLIDEKKIQGVHNVVWDGTNNSGAIVGTGVYFVKMIAGDYQKIQKMLLIK